MPSPFPKRILMRVLVMAAINSAGEVSRPLPISDTLFFKIQGSEAAIGATAKAVRETTAKHGSTRFEFAQTDEEAVELWDSRKYALISTIGSVPGARCWTTDVWCVLNGAVWCGTVLTWCEQCAAVEAAAACVRDEEGPRGQQAAVDHCWPCGRRSVGGGVSGAFVLLMWL